MNKHDFVFGVFNNGNLSIFLGRVTCNHAVASFIVGILDLAKDCLKNGDYFACDWTYQLKGFV